MGKLWLKISIIAVVIAFLGTSFVPANSLIDHTSSNNLLSGHIKTNDQSSSSDPSVHLYVNGNGYVIFSANYTVCCISFNYDNDKTQNFTSNDVPTGTVFHLVSSPNSGYAFQKWTGSVNSTSNSINVTVDQNINEEAIYEKILTFSANFTESALPTGNTWYVNITGLQTSGPITQTSYNVSLPNGTYTFYVATTNRDYAPNPYSNSFTVSGSPVSVPEITFSLETYILTFTESGLPEGIWYVNLSNGDQGSAVAGSPITFSLPNESYSYTTSTSNKLYHSSSYTGTVDVIGNTSVSILFVQTTYIVQFTETGLPSGQSWYVNITETNGTIYHSGAISTSSYSFSLTNGSYSFSVASANRIYAPSPPSTSFTLNGSLLSESITFNEVLYSVAFTESGLPSGESWYVNLSNGISSGPITGSSYTFSLTNGSYTYTIASANKIYAPNLTSGSFTVDGSSLSKSITFNEVLYSVAFTESGLPSGMFWYVNISGMVSSGPISSGSNYTVTLTNGTYSYSISTSNKTYAPVSSLNSLIVNGSSLKVVANITEVTYNVVFSESGLPSGLTWYVNLSNGMDSGPITSASYSFLLPNGTYTYTIASENKIYSPTPISSAINVNGLALSEIIQFNEVTYTVTFQETGLPSGTTWYVNLSNGMDSGPITGSSYIFSLTNGSYSYKISPSNKIYAPNLTSGSFTVYGSPLSFDIKFFAVTYTVTFQESGLPSGTTWYVNITGMASSGPITINSYSIDLTNGTYLFAISTSDKNYAPSYNNSFTVKGSNASIPVGFKPVIYDIQFNSMNLPLGDIWYVNLSNGIYSGPITSSTYTVYLQNGSYSFSVASANKIYAPSYVSAFTVNGSSLTIPVTFTEILYNLTIQESGLPTGTEWNLTFDGTIYQLTNASYIFSVPNGTYSFFAASHDYKDVSGTITVNGSSFVYTINMELQLYEVTFNETGLPSGTSWYVNISGTEPSGPITSSTYSISLTNGTYSFTISTSNKIYAPYYTDSFLVEGLNQSISVTFKPVLYNFVFTSTNLPSGDLWYVNLSNGMDSGPIIGSSFSFNLTNGSYSFTISSANKIYAPNLTSGLFTVHGYPLSFDIRFIPVTYTVTFQETGLPSGTTWYVNITESNGTTYISGQITGSSYAFSLTNGSYTFTIATSDKIYESSILSGSITITGSSLSKSITFSEVLYSVTFTESGLPTGTTWYVNLSNGMGSGPITGSSYSFSLTNGSYSYTVATSNKIYTSPSGSFTVNGSPISESIAFSMVKYVVTFTETGLPSGFYWYVNGSGLLGYESTQGSIAFKLSNGTYSFTVTNLSSYYTTTSHFTVVINGKNVTENVNYYHWAYITGSISPANADLTVNGKTVSLTSSGSFNISVPNGTYHAVISDQGYISYYSNFTLNSGNDKNLTVSLEPIPAPSISSNTVLYTIIGVVIAITVVSSMVVMVKKRK